MIDLSIFRVSTDGNFLEVIAECPYDFEFISFQINIPTDFKKKEFEIYQINIPQNQNKLIIKIPISSFNQNIHLYQATFKAHIKEDPIKEWNVEEFTLQAVCSDVNFVYDYLLDDVINLTSFCSNKESYDRLIKNYLILYAHQEAMRLNHIYDALYFYNILLNNFKKCGNFDRFNQKIYPDPACNCGKL